MDPVTVCVGLDTLGCVTFTLPLAAEELVLSDEELLSPDCVVVPELEPVEVEGGCD